MLFSSFTSVYKFHSIRRHWNNITGSWFLVIIYNPSLNQMQGIPRSFAELCYLSILDLCYNNLAGDLSQFIRNLKRMCRETLKILKVCGNELHGSLPDITRFSSMRILDLPDNQLNGSLTRFQQYSKIIVLSLGGNHLIGSLPDFIMLPSLSVLSIYENRLNGTIPETIGNPSELKHLDVGFNSLEGVVSEAHFLNLSKSQHLDLSYNSLTSQFPSYWMPPFNLDSLHLGFCDMGPRFPKWLVGQTNISELDISGARISDNIPVWFWNLSPYLSFLNLSNNQMSGMLPNLSSEYPLYIGTDFSSNQFEGP